MRKKFPAVFKTDAFAKPVQSYIYMKKWFMIFDRYFLPPYNKMMLS